jgi:hypothetical protein
MPDLKENHDLIYLHESEALFSTPDHLHGHIRALHNNIWKDLDETSIATLTKESLSVDSKLDTCPLCCFTFKGLKSIQSSSADLALALVEMEDHIVQHLQNLMILSLRLMETQNGKFDDDGEADSMIPEESQIYQTDHPGIYSELDKLSPFGSPNIHLETSDFNEVESLNLDDIDNWSAIVDKTR